MQFLRYPNVDLTKSGWTAEAVHYNVSQETVRSLIVRQLETPERHRVPGASAQWLIKANAGTLSESALIAMWKSAELPMDLLRQIEPKVRDGESEQRAAEELLKSNS